MKKRILVTGGAGFIGSHLTERLLDRGGEIFVIDDLSTGRIENIEHLKRNPDFHLTIDSILNKETLEPLIERADEVYHLAAAVGVRYVVENPLKTLKTNTVGTENVLELASRTKTKVLLTSSSEVYGKNDCAPFREDSDSIHGATHISRWGYAASKAVGEFLGLAYWREKKTPVVIARFFNTVGPRQSSMYGMVIPTFVRLALKNEPITVYGTGEQTRCFAHVNDIVDTTLALMDCEKATGEICNIGNPEEVSIHALAEKVKSIAHSKSPIVKIPYEETYHQGFEDMMRRVPNISKIQRLVDFKPKYNLENIIKDVIQYYQHP